MMVSKFYFLKQFLHSTLQTTMEEGVDWVFLLIPSLKDLRTNTRASLSPCFSVVNDVITLVNDHSFKKVERIELQQHYFSLKIREKIESIEKENQENFMD